MRYAQHVSTQVTPQQEPIPLKAQVPNNAGGYVFAVDDWTRLDRFLILGAEGNTYYATEKDLTKENATAVLLCLQEDGERAVRRILEISYSGRAPKNTPAIFALALAAAWGNPSTRSLALNNLNTVCRTGTHLFEFLEAVLVFRGKGYALRKAVAKWYTSQTPRDLAYQVTKYQSRGKWSHKDILRLGWVQGLNNSLYRWIVGRDQEPREVKRYQTKEGKHHYLRTDSYPAVNDSLPEPIQAFEAAKRATTKGEIVKIINNYHLVRECIPTQWLNEPEVWEALLEKMPLTAMVRNLGKMTAVGLLAPFTQAVNKVLTNLANQQWINQSRIHPIALLSAARVYAQGRGEKGKLTWSPVSQIVDALDGAFYLAFANVEPTNLRWLLGLDISGSMNSGTIAGVPGLTPRVASAAMALVTANTEKQHLFLGFTAGEGSTMYGTVQNMACGVSQLAISPRQRLDDVCRYTHQLPMGRTDCALPMLYAQEKKIPVDVFVIYTDNETWAGKIHPCQALQQYRQKMGIGAKCIVVGMTATEFTIADPTDAGMLDIVGFDAVAPALMNDFAVGR